MAVKPLVNLEGLLTRIGNAGRFQVILVFLIKMPAAPFAWTLMEMSFVKAEPKWCCVPSHVNEKPEEYCHRGNVTFGDECPDDVNECSVRLFEESMDTIINEWDLVCDEKWKANLSISIQMVGDLAGALFTGYIANQFGRKKTLFISIGCLTIFSLISGFSTSWEMFMVFRFFLGFSCGIYFVVSIPYMMEFLSPSKREIPALLPVYALGGLLMALTSWRVHHWRWLHWICAAMVFPFGFSWFFIPESLRWLTVKGKLDEAERVVAYIARINSKSVPDETRQILETVYKEEQAKNAYAKSYNYIDIYRGWNLFKLSVILQVIWFSFSFCGYGIVFGASTLGLDLYLNLSVLTIVAMPVLLGVYIAMRWVGRKTISIVLLSLSALCGLASIVVYLTVSDDEDSSLITNILCLAANGFLGGAWTAIVILNNEAYPTVLRSLGFAAASIASKIGGIVAPHAFDFDAMTILAYALIAGFMGLSAVLVFFLKETHGVDLPDTLHDSQKSDERNAIKRPDNRKEEAKFLLGSSSDQTQSKYGDSDQSLMTRGNPAAAIEKRMHSNDGFYGENRL